MPAYTTYGQDPTPLGTEKPDVPASFAAYANSIDRKLNHTVATQAERDSRFTGAPAGVYVTCVPLQKVWLSTGYSGGVQGWITVYQPPVVTTPPDTTLDATLNHTATSQADRDARYKGAPAGLLVTAPALGLVWVSNGTSGGVTSWTTVMEDTGWISDGFIYTDAHYVNNPASGKGCKVRRRNGVVYVVIDVVYNPGSDNAQSFSVNGRCTDVTVLRVPAGFAPANEQTTRGRISAVSLTAILTANNGDFVITDGTPSQTFETPDFVRANYSYPVG